MEVECRLVSNGIYCGDSAGYHSEEAKALRAVASEWISLLHIDSDDDAGMMCGDVGTIYYWIRRQDLAQGAFDRAWLILQCS
jgi:uncharacterized protein YwqG